MANPAACGTALLRGGAEATPLPRHALPSGLRGFPLPRCGGAVPLRRAAAGSLHAEVRGRRSLLHTHTRKLSLRVPAPAARIFGLPGCFVKKKAQSKPSSGSSPSPFIWGFIGAPAPLDHGSRSRLPSFPPRDSVLLTDRFRLGGTLVSAEIPHLRFWRTSSKF